IQRFFAWKKQKRNPLRRSDELEKVWIVVKVLTVVSNPPQIRNGSPQNPRSTHGAIDLIGMHDEREFGERCEWTSDRAKARHFGTVTGPAKSPHGFIVHG